jgi:prepilin-type N-terminal cleavage/methylation domain-containing protein
MASQGVLDLRPTSPPKGFSLIETLVVLAMVGIVMAAASLSFVQSGRKGLEAHASRLQMLAAAVSDRAVLLNRPHRLVVDRQGIWVEERLRGQWRDGLPPPFQFRPWTDHVGLASEPLILGFSRTGQTTGAEFTLSRGADRASVRVDVLTPSPIAGL